MSQPDIAAKRMRVTVGDNKGTSLLECFTAEEIRTHLWVLLNPTVPPPLNSACCMAMLFSRTN